MLLAKVQRRISARWLLRGGLSVTGQRRRQNDTALASTIDESREKGQEVNGLREIYDGVVTLCSPSTRMADISLLTVYAILQG